MKTIYKHYKTCRYCQTPIMKGKMKMVVRKWGSKEPMFFHPHCFKTFKGYIGKEVRQELWNKLKNILKY
jgi:ribosomal protein L24E